MLTEIVLPTALGAIMFGIGMSLQTKDFVLLRTAPRPVLIGLLAQLLIMPLIALAIVWALPVTQDIALGILLLAACPGGTMSNAMSQLLRADLALSVSLTTLSTSLCIFTTPLLLNTTFSLFSDEITFTSSSMLAVSGRLLFIALLPVIAGMLFRRAFPMRALKMIPAFQRFAFVFLCLLIIVMVWREYETLVQTSGTLFGSVMMLIVLTSSAGFLIGRICNQSFRVCKTLCRLQLLFLMPLPSPSFPLYTDYLCMVAPLLLLQWCTNLRPNYDFGIQNTHGIINKNFLRSELFSRKLNQK